MLNAQIKSRLRAFFAKMIPTGRVTVMNPWAEQASMTERLDVERVHEIIESAKSGDPRDLFSLYRDIITSDSHLQSEFAKRKLAVLGDTLAVVPKDKKNPDDVVAAKVITDMIDSLKVPDPGNVASCSWIRACSHLMDSILWPVAAVEKVFRPSSKPGLRYELSELVAVPHFLLTYVPNQEDATGLMKVREVNNFGYPTGMTTEVDGNRYIIHRGHLLTTHDLWGGPMRSILFWWLLGTMNREWWGRFLERYGSPFLLGKYDQGDDASRSILERAFGYAVKIGGLVVSRNTEVELVQAASSQSADGYEKFIRLCNEEKSKLVVGQILSADSKSTGLGSGVANQHGKVRDDIRQFDSIMLAETIDVQLCAQYLRINGIPGRVKLLWGSVSPEEKQALGDMLVSLKQAGLEPADDAIEAISEEVGFEVRRSMTPSLTAPGVTSLSSSGLIDPTDTLAANGAAKLSRTFRGSLAPVRRIILLSSSPDDLQKRLSEFYSDWAPDQVAEVIDQALLAFAANGIK